MVEPVEEPQPQTQASAANNRETRYRGPLTDPVVPPPRTCEHGKTYSHPLWNGPFGSPLSQIVDSCPGPVVPLPEPDEHDGFTVHPDLTPRLERHLRLLVAELGVCCRDHYEDERLARVEANVRWLLGERI